MSSRGIALRERPNRRTYGDIVITQILPQATPPRWTCHHHAHGSEIEAYVAAVGNIEVIAEVRQAEGMSARANAEVIVRAVNEHEKCRPLLSELADFMEKYLGLLPEESRREGEFLCRKARKV